MGQWKEFDVIQQLRFYDRLKELLCSINPPGSEDHHSFL